MITKLICFNAVIFSYSIFTDWFSVGKGPDPMQAKLDREMDAYQSARAATASAAATVDVNATAVAAPAAESMEA